MNKKYYKAYDYRYKQVHEMTNKAWAGDGFSPSIEKLLKKYGANENSSILEVGCGEGQNAIHLLLNNFNVEACDVSKEAIKWCKLNADKCNVDKNKFFVMDALNNRLDKKYDFIYSVAVLHMLVNQSDRDKFLKFFYDHLKDNGIGFVIVMGNGVETRKTNPDDAFNLVEREFNGKTIKIASTSCRMVTKAEFLKEIDNANLKLLNFYLDYTISGFNVCMVAEIMKK